MSYYIFIRICWHPDYALRTCIISFSLLFMQLPLNANESMIMEEKSSCCLSFFVRNIKFQIH